MVKLIPATGKVIVRRSEAAEVSKGGIIIPDTAKSASEEGEVLAIGVPPRTASGAVDWPVFKSGDRVLFSKYAGTDATVVGEKYLILDHADVIAAFARDA